MPKEMPNSIPQTVEFLPFNLKGKVAIKKSLYSSV
jgi:hypothetical protein